MVVSDGCGAEPTTDGAEPAEAHTEARVRRVAPPAAPPAEAGARERLLREGKRLFVQLGFAGVSTRQICVAAGVTQPSLYHHFGNKEGLYHAVIHSWFAETHDAMEAAIAGAPNFRERLLALAIFFWSGRAGEYQAMQHDALQHIPLESRGELRVTIRSSVVEPLLALMREGIAGGDLPTHADPYALMQLYWALVDGFTGLYHRGDPLPPPEANVAAIDLFIAGARALSPAALAAWPTLPNLHTARSSADAET